MTVQTDRLAAIARSAGLVVREESEFTGESVRINQTTLSVDLPVTGYVYVVATLGLHSKRWSHAAYIAYTNSSDLTKVTMARALSVLVEERTKALNAALEAPSA